MRVFVLRSTVVQLIDSGATKQQGVVKKMTHDYGFLQSLTSSDTVYFNAADVVQSREGEHPRVGSQVSLPKFDPDRSWLSLHLLL